LNRRELPTRLFLSIESLALAAQFVPLAEWIPNMAPKSSASSTSSTNAHFDVETVRSAAAGRTLELLERVAGIKRDHLSRNHGPCPKCGGQDRFRLIDESAGAVLCNQCFSERNGDFFAAIQWMMGCDFLESVKLAAEYLGVKPEAKGKKGGKKDSPSDPEESLDFLEWNDLNAASWCIRAKPGVLPIALQRVGARKAKHAGCVVIAIPVWGAEAVAAVQGGKPISEVTPCGWTLYNIAGGPLPKKSRDNKTGKATLDMVKVKLAPGSSPGIMCDLTAITSPICTHLWKLEGPTDLLAALSLSDVPTHVGFVTNANGAGEIPHSWMVDLFADRFARVLHDADQPGEDGSNAKWSPALTTTAKEVRQIRLPYAVESSHGKDLRDYLCAGHSFKDLAAIEESAPIFKVAPGVEIRINYDGKKQTVTAKQPSHNGDKKADDDPHRLARMNLDQYAKAHGGGALRFWRGEWWGWKPARGKYRKIAEEELRSKLAAAIEAEFDRIAEYRRALGETEAVATKVTNSLLSNVLTATASLCYVPDTVELLTWLDDSRKNSGRRRTLIAMKNGLIDLDAILEGRDDDVLIPHTERWFSTVCLPYEFRLNATCPKWEAMLEKCLEMDPERIKILQEFAGYLLLPDTSHQKLLCLEGEGANGKSSFLAGLTAIIGKDNCSCLSLEDFADQFAMSDTLGKLANIAADVPKTVDHAMEAVIKRFASGDRVSMNRKGLSRISVSPTARLVMSWNERPYFKDRSQGLWRRIILIPFQVQIKKSERIAGMDKPEYWEHEGELPGMFYWALKGLIRLRQQGGFTESKISEASIDDYRCEANPAREFLKEFLEAEGDFSISSDDVYRVYKKWAKDSDYRILDARQFGKEIRKNFPSVERRKLGTQEKREYFLFGVRWRVDSVNGEAVKNLGFLNSDDDEINY